jgi:putative peptidoglycan lipid II flippase
VARLMAPTVLGSSVYLINMVVSRFLGLSLNDAAVSVLNYATRLMELPIGVFAVAVSTVVFPLISRYAAQGDLTEMGAAYRKGMRLILLINVPAAAGLTLLADPIIRLLFQHGAFGPQDTQAMTPILAIFAVGLPFFSFVNLILRAFYAFKDTGTPVVAAVISFVVNVVLSLVLMERFSTLGLAIASNVAVVAQATYLQVRLTRRGSQFAFGHLWVDLLKILAAMAGMSVVVYGIWWAWTGQLGRSLLWDGVGVAVGIGFGVTAYAALVFLLRVEGRDEFLRLARGLVGKFRRGRSRDIVS